MSISLPGTPHQNALSELPDSTITAFPKSTAICVIAVSGMILLRETERRTGHNSRRVPPIGTWAWMQST